MWGVMAPRGVTMPAEITAERLTSLFRPRSVALVGASDKSAFSQLAYHNQVRFGYAERTYLVNRRGVETHGRPAAWQRIDAAADAGHGGALKLESFFVGQVVGSFSRLRPAAGITRQIVDDCEARLAELAALLPSGAPAAP